jgi:hypothetical protein
MMIILSVERRGENEKTESARSAKTTRDMQ